jgi:Tfp pilus assembly protein PilF
MDDIIQEALDKGVKLHAAGQLDLAAQLYEAALKLKPNHREANHHMGRLKIDQGKQLVSFAIFKSRSSGKPRQVRILAVLH